MPTKDDRISTGIEDFALIDESFANNGKKKKNNNNNPVSPVGNGPVCKYQYLPQQSKVYTVVPQTENNFEVVQFKNDHFSCRSEKSRKPIVGYANNSTGSSS
ncbi:hypothetical protein M569_15762 [Genlisea aurea]|uniref:Uncharacterized protein n=1 Tax=Genlisea aurea TaxID=192259 RepID=S8D8M5_9LAMI|nr:hypothetical protein M569_15762 [Genlisea aurea]